MKLSKLCRSPIAAFAILLLTSCSVFNEPLALAENPSNANRAGTLAVPILMYHHVGNPLTIATYSVDLHMFEWQMDYLAEQGYTTVSLDQIMDALNGKAALPPKPIAITFDDGWAHQISNTLPALQKHGFKATYYIIVNVLDRNASYMTWAQVKQLRDAGMWIGSHTLTHRNMKRLRGQALQNELVQSKKILEEQLGIPITTFAYPGGAFNKRVEKATQAAGYTSAVTVLKGYAQSIKLPYRLQRVGVYGVDTEERFIAKIDQTFFKKQWPRPDGQAHLPDEVPDPGAINTDTNPDDQP